MPQRDGPRLEGRDHEIWQRYVGGWTQARLAAEYEVSQQRISQVLSEIRASIPDTARTDAALLARERTDALLAAVWDDAMSGDTRAVTAALRVLERQARALGTDAPEPLSVSLERRLDVEGDVVVDAISAVIDVLGLDEERRQLALSAAVAKLSGEELPAPTKQVAEELPDVRAGMEATLRELVADEPEVDVEALLREVDEEGRTDG